MVSPAATALQSEDAYCLKCSPWFAPILSSVFLPTEVVLSWLNNSELLLGFVRCVVLLCYCYLLLAVVVTAPPPPLNYFEAMLFYISCS